MVLLLMVIPALSQTAPDLGSTSPFGIVSETFTNTAGTTVDGDVCYTTPPAVNPTVTGTIFVPCPPETGTDQNAARAYLDVQACTDIGAAVALDQISIGGGPAGEFPPGCYSSSGAMTITADTTVTLSGDGVFIFRPAGALSPAAGSSVIAADGVCTDNVFWTPGGGTTIGANAAFVGTVFRGTAAGLSITLGDSATLEGRALAFGSTVTTANNTITVPDACAEEPGTIIVEKKTNPPGSLQSFAFTGDAAGNLIDDGQIIVDNLAPGNYSSTETVPEGWKLTDIVCNDADSTGDLTTATANFVLDAGETVTCVFTNTQRGSITVEKQTLPEGSLQAFDFTGDVAGSLTDGNSITVLVDPGTYTSTETLPAGWDLTSIVCDDSDSTGNTGTATATFNVAADEAVRCVFTNTQRGTIVVEKQTLPDGSPDAFTFTGNAAGEISDGQQITVGNLVPGNYSSTETVPANWKLTGISCNDGNSSGDVG
ncbi:DUF3494 domain-containing protein, partial [Wenzhouxiangella sp. XN201]|uniref:prealbumin-like fold domain-containing protein n=1 Tax=Wenzhouxiangella sp. XN201 TaxID=2710755 RepID=UPI0013C628A4|nr:DUF3494 domain-containing protein [Wenzhouxiangella sp. XN201]